MVLATNLFCSNQERAKRLPPDLAGADSRQPRHNKSSLTRPARSPSSAPQSSRRSADKTTRNPHADNTCSQLAYLPLAHIRDPRSICHEAEVRAWSPCKCSYCAVGLGVLRKEEREGRKDGWTEGQGPFGNNSTLDAAATTGREWMLDGQTPLPERPTLLGVK